MPTEKSDQGSVPLSDSKVKIFAAQTENFNGDVDKRASSERLAELHQEKVSFPCYKLCSCQKKC